MSAEAVPKIKYSYEECLQLEEQEGIRYEYYNSELVAMEGVSLNHNRITSNINREFANRFDGPSCEVFQEGVKLLQEKSNAYLYPDVMVTCDSEDIESNYLIKNPSLIVEVLSPSTAEKDRGEKLSIYRRISSLRYYLLVDQNRPYIEVYSRSKAVAIFQYQVYEQLEDVISFPELNLNLSLNQIYRNVRFQ